MSEGTSDRPRSVFVTTIGWIFAVLAGFGTLITAMQNLMLHVAFPLERMQRHALHGEAAERMPDMARFMFAHFEWFFALALVATLTTLVAAIGLLRRWNAARLVFIGLMGIGVIWNLGGLVFQYLFMADMPMPADAPAEVRRGFEVMQAVMTVVGAAIALVFSVLFGWIAWMLCRPHIAAEFRTAGGA